MGKTKIILIIIFSTIIFLLGLIFGAYFLFEEENREYNAYESKYIIVDTNYNMLLKGGSIDNIYRYSINGSAFYAIGANKGYIIANLESGQIVKQSKEIKDFSDDDQEYFLRKYLFRYKDFISLKKEQKVIGENDEDALEIFDFFDFNYGSFEPYSYYIRNNYMIFTECGTKPTWGGGYHYLIPMFGWKEDDPELGYTGDPIIENVVMLDWNERYIGVKTEFLGKTGYIIFDTSEKKILLTSSNFKEFNKTCVETFGSKFNLKKIDQQAKRARGIE
jgi:hypothetical protein